MELSHIVQQVAAGLRAADARSPQAASQRGTRVYQPGIGPHAEDAAMRLTLTEWRRDVPDLRAVQGFPYPDSRFRCDLGLGDPLEWAIEVKMARAYGDNGKLDDTYVKDLLSPYPRDRSALTDAQKLSESGFACRKALLIYGFDYPDRPVETV
jgi:hypothetical protein